MFLGSFDPITLGHKNIIEKALLLFDKIVIGIGENDSKNNLFHALQNNPSSKKNKEVKNCSYDLNSPINYVDLLKGNYLLIHGSVLKKSSIGISTLALFFI